MSSKVAILPTRLRWQILNLVGKVKISDAQTLCSLSPDVILRSERELRTTPRPFYLHHAAVLLETREYGTQVLSKTIFFYNCYN